MIIRLMLTITAMVFAVGMSGIVMGLPSITQADAASPPGKYGACVQARNSYDQWILDLSGKEMADDRKAFCEPAKP